MDCYSQAVRDLRHCLTYNQLRVVAGLREVTDLGKQAVVGLATMNVTTVGPQNCRSNGGRRGAGGWSSSMGRMIPEADVGFCAGRTGDIAA